MLSAIAALGCGSATELTAPEDEGVIQQAAAFQVLQQTGDGFVCGGTVVGQFLPQFRVLVPELATGSLGGGGVVNLHHAHAALCETSRHEALLAEGGGDGVIQTVEFLGGFRLLLHTKGLRCLRLHAKRQLKGGDAGLQPGIGGALGFMQAVLRHEEIQLGTLGGGGHLRISQVGHGVGEVLNQGAWRDAGRKLLDQSGALAGWAG